MKVYIGVTLLVLAAVMSSASGWKALDENGNYRAPWTGKELSQASGKRAKQLTQAYDQPNCGLNNFPAYTPRGCVYMGPDNKVDSYGICNASNSPYRSWCESCYDFPGQKFLGQAVGTTYTDQLLVSSDDGLACANAMATNSGDCDCEFNPDTCPTPNPPSSCWRSVDVKTNCLADTKNDFDFTPYDGLAGHGLVNYCCGLEPEEFNNDEDPTINDCFAVTHNAETGCIEDAVWQEGETCYPVEGTVCVVGTCQTVGGVRTCASGDVSCDDGNDCTEDPAECDPFAGCDLERPLKEDGTPCRTSEPCMRGGTCSEGVCANAVPIECPSGSTCDTDTNQCVEQVNADILPMVGAAAGGLCCLGAAAAIMAKKRKDALEESKRDSLMTQKTDNMGRGDMGMDARKSGMSAVTSFSRAPGAAGGASGGADFDQVSYATRRSDAVSVQSRVSRVSNGTRTTRSSQGSAGRRSSSGRGSAGRRESEKYDFKSSGTRSSGGRSSQSRSRNSHGTRSSGSRSRSQGSRGRH